MGTLAIFVVVVGLVIVAIGVFVLAKPGAVAEPVRKVDGTLSVEDILKQVVELLKLFDKKLRVGVFLTLVGLAVMTGGIFLATRDAADKAADAPAAALSGALIPR